MRQTPQVDNTPLQKGDDLFRLLVEAVTEYAIFALDAEGNVLTWNQGAYRLKGYSAPEVIGSHFSRFYTKADIERRHPQHELELASRHGKYEEEGWRVRKDGTTFWANVVITALRDERGALRGFGKVTRDLTERKMAEENLREAYADLERRIAARTEELSKAKIHAEDAVKSRDEFISMASHELKTPLTTLKLQTQFRKRRVGKGDYSAFTPEKLAALCEGDDRQLQRLTDLVDRMLDISRISSGHFELSTEQFDLAECVRELVARLSPSLEENDNNVSFVAPAPVNGTWDRLRLEQAFSNLLMNAGKYAPGTEIEARVTAAGNKASVAIRDRGNGISQEDQAKIFEPFERLKQTGGVSGLGLGLYITRQIVDAHGGTIRVESEPGMGCTFIVELPLQPPPRSADAS